MKTSTDSVTTAIYQDATLKKDGTQTLYLRLTVNRKIKTFATGIAIPSKFWDKNKQQIKTHVAGLANARDLASNLATQKADLDKIILDLQSKKQPVTIASIERVMLKATRTNLVAYCEWRRECEKAQRARGTWVGYGSKIAALKKFDPDVELAEVTTRWLEEFTEWLFALGEYKNNTIVSFQEYLRKIFQYAAKHGDIAENPFLHFGKLRRKAVEKHYLTSEELTRLLEMYHQGFFLTENLPKKYRYGRKDSYHQSLQRLLASCFCGLRFSDISKLKPSDFHGTYFSIVMKKGKEPLRIPINKSLRSVLNLEEGAKSVLDGRNFTNGMTNAKLAVIMELAKIDKHITFHSGRHTFAIMGLEMGIPIEVVSHILGHHDLATTQIYARVVDKQKTREMAKMDAFVLNTVQPTSLGPKMAFMKQG